MKSLTAAVVFQACWLACILLAASGRPVLATAVALVPAALRLTLTPRRGAEAVLLAVAVVAGLIVDGGLAAAGLVAHPAQATIWPSPWPAPWMLALWAAFAALLPGPLAWLARRPLAAAALGALGAPSSYLAGQRLGAVALQGSFSIPVIACAWAIAMPALCLVAKRCGVLADARIPPAPRDSPPRPEGSASSR